MRRAEWLVERPWRLVLLVLLIVAPLLLVAEIAASDTQRRVDVEEREALRSLASRGADASAARAATLFEKLVGAASTSRLKGAIGLAIRREAGAPREVVVAADVRELSFQLSAFHAVMQDEVATLFVLDQAGFVLELDPPGGARGDVAVGADLIGAPYAEAVIAARAERYAGADSSGRVLAFATPLVPLFDREPTRTGVTGRQAGALVAELRPGFLESPIRSLSSAVADFYIVDGEGRLLARLNGEARPLLEDLRQHPAVASALAGTPYLGESHDPITRTPSLVTTAPIGNLGWHAVVVGREDALRAEVDAGLAQQRVLRVGLIAVLLLGAALVGGASSAAIRQRRETAEALKQQTATADVLKTISRSAFDLQAVFDVVVENATKLCRGDWGYLFRREGDVFRLIASHGGTAELLEYERAHPTTITDRTLMGRVALRRAVVHIPDLFEDPDYDWPANREHGVHTVLGVPIFRDDEVVGAIGVARNERQPFSDADIRLVQTFADQATIAMENVRLFSETKDALAQQTALSEVLKTISRSAFDLDAVLQTIVERAAALCDADGAAIHRRVGDVAVTAASFGDIGAVPGGITAIDDRTVIGRGLLTGQRQYVPDARQHPDLPQDGPNTRLNIPFVRDGVAVGALAVTRRVARPFSDAELRLFEVFADQAAIAIENVRLFSQTKESLERQTALAEILRVIADSPSDRQPVLEAVARSATRYCGAEDAVVFLVDGNELRRVAHHGPIPMRNETAPLDDRGVAGHAVLTRRTIHVADIESAEGDRYPLTRAFAGQSGRRGSLAAPLLREGTPIGVILLRKMEPTGFSQSQIQLVEAFADQAMIAIENVRLFNETKEALERQVALGDVLRTMASSPGDLRPVLDAIAQNAARFCAAEDCGVALLRADGLLEQVAHFGPLTRELAPWPVDRGSVRGRAIVDRRVIHVEDMLAEREEEYPIGLRRAREVGQRTVLAAPLLREGTPLGAIALRRSNVKPFTDRQIDLLRTFADQAAIAIENVRLFNETKSALERQTAVAQVLGEISQSAFDLGPVLETVIEHATKLCAAQQGFIYRRDGDLFRLAVSYGITPEFKEFTETHPLSGTDLGTVTGRAVQRRTTVHVPDVLQDPEYTYWEAQKRGKYRALLGVPMIRDDTVIGVINLWRTDPEPFTPEQIELVTTFANQATIAIENVRLFDETKEALERQTSISDVLQTIGRSAFDLQPVLDTVVERAVKLCDAREGSISTLENGVYRTRSYWSASPLSPEYIDLMRNEVRVPDRGSLIGRTALEGQVVHIDDALADPEYTVTDMQQAAGFRTLLGVPLLRDRSVIGVFALTRSDVRPFTDRQIELVRTFADQAAIAIENTRLFGATKEALDQQTAVGEVLKTISRSAFDLQPVLDIVLNNAVRLAGADIGWLSRVENDQFTTVAYSTEFPQAVRDELIRQRAQGHIAGPWVPLGTGGGLMGFTLAEGRTVHLPDVTEDPTLRGSVVARLTESRTVVGVPMLREGRTIGGMVLARYEVRPFGEREIELVQTFADQAAIAIENVRLFDETRESLQQQTATAEVLKVISRSVFDLPAVLHTVVESAARLADAEVAWLNHAEGDRSRVGAFYGNTAELQRRVDGELSAVRPIGGLFPLLRQTATSRAILDRKVVHVADITMEPDLQKSGFARAIGARTVLAVPLVRESTAIGALALARLTPRPFSEREIALVQTFADQAVIAIENVRLFNEIESKSQQLEVASRHKSEFLANMSHELRTPLNAIIGFSEVLVQGLFGDVNEKQREYLQDVIGSGQHLLSLINDILDLSKIEAGRMELELSTFSLRDALDSGLTIVRERASRHNIAINAIVADDLGELEADERKVKQIFYNLLSNAVKFTADGGRVEVSARRENGDARVEVRDSGIGIAEEDQARIFEEFQQVGRERSREGTGLGLTLTKRFVELHGGRISLQSAPGKGSTFTFTLPLRQPGPVPA